MTMRDSRGYSVRLLKQIEAADQSAPVIQLAKLCVAHDIPVLTVAKAIGTSKQTVYAWFSGRHRPSPVFNDRISELLRQYRGAVAA